MSGSRFRRRNYGRNHGYLFDGLKIMSVTKVLGIGVPKPALVQWAAGQAAQYAVLNSEALFDGRRPLAVVEREIADAANRKRNAAAVKGTTVHRFGERLVKGERVDGISDEVGKKVDSYVKFLNEWRVEDLATERPVLITAAPVPIGGTFDLVFRSPLFPERTFLADIKTGSGVYGEAALQAEAYSRAEVFLDENDEEVPMSSLGITDHVVIHVRDDGYSVVQLADGDDAWAAFLAAVGMARLMDGPRGESELDSLVLGEFFRPAEAWT